MSRMMESHNSLKHCRAMNRSKAPLRWRYLFPESSVSFLLIYSAMVFRLPDRVMSWSENLRRLVIAIALALVYASNAAAQENGDMARITVIDQQILQLYNQ